nr:MAG TPA: hypothetical protein [Caudoviricetes sp.]
MKFSFNDYDDTADTKQPTREAMGLASMNPVMGVSGQGCMLVNVMNHDKDLELGWKDYKAVCRSMDPNDDLYGIDQNGRILAKHKHDVMDSPDIVTECYIIKTPDVDKVMSSIEEEASLPYEDRPVHQYDYIYESFTGKKLLSESQLDLDPLLEKVELDKMSGVMSGESSNTDKLSGPAANNKPEGTDYIPDVDNLNGMVENSLLDIDPYNILEAIDKVQTVEPYERENIENTLDESTFHFGEDSVQEDIQPLDDNELKAITEDLDTLQETKNNIDKFFNNNSKPKKPGSFSFDDNSDLDELEPKYDEPIIPPTQERFSFKDL